MSTFKRAKVVMLPTNEKAPISLDLIDADMVLGSRNDGTYVNQHLYFLSDDEIGEGDWFYDGEDVLRCSKVTDVIIDREGQWSDPKTSKRIIATTDKSLDFRDYLESGQNRTFRILPQPSQSFIEKFVEEYNKVNVIDEVLIEYEKIHVGWEPDYSAEHLGIEGSKNMYENFLKINHKDNTITIKKVKNNWTKEEIIDGIEKAMAKGLSIGQYRDLIKGL